MGGPRMSHVQARMDSMIYSLLELIAKQKVQTFYLELSLKSMNTGSESSSVPF